MAKGKGSFPVERIKLKRKDGKEGVGTNRDGTTYKAMHVEFGAIFENERGKSVALSPGFGITYNGKPVADCFINVFDARPRDEREVEDPDDEAAESGDDDEF